MQTLSLTIEGMTCGGCAKSVSSILLSIDGVESAIVNLERKNAEITFDEQKTHAQALIAAIEDGGFEASL